MILELLGKEDFNLKEINPQLTKLRKTFSLSKLIKNKIKKLSLSTQEEFNMLSLIASQRNLKNSGSKFKEIQTISKLVDSNFFSSESVLNTSTSSIFMSTSSRNKLNGEKFLTLH